MRSILTILFISLISLLNVFIYFKYIKLVKNGMTSPRKIKKKKFTEIFILTSCLSMTRYLVFIAYLVYFNVFKIHLSNDWAEFLATFLFIILITLRALDLLIYLKLDKKLRLNFMTKLKKILWIAGIY